MEAFLDVFGPIFSFNKCFHVNLDMLSDLFQLTQLFQDKTETKVS